METTCPKCSSRKRHYMLGRDEESNTRLWVCGNDDCGIEFVTDEEGQNAEG